MHATIYHRTYALVGIVALFPYLAATQKGSGRTNGCRYLPGDPEWPTAKDWSLLNDTIGGRLIRGTPLAQPCHTPTLDISACAKIQQEWILTGS